ncbi:hypothetical protein CEF21_09500 [Bacillus sp. FJAT-42376]|nr:hypothetical protein CEF21_09500 [Bacillus sp. FJAT-42376]
MLISNIRATNDRGQLKQRLLQKSVRLVLNLTQPLISAGISQLLFQSIGVKGLKHSVKKTKDLNRLIYKKQGNAF